MKKLRLVWFMIFVLIISVASVYAESSFIDISNDQKMAATLKVGFLLPRDNGYHQNYQDNNFELAFRYKFTPFIATEAGIGYFQFYQVKANDLEKIVVHGVPVTATLKAVLPLYFGDFYAGGGVGEYVLWGDSGVPASKTIGRGGVHAGAGGEVYLGSREMVLLDYKRTWIGSEHSISFDVISLGFGYRF